MRLENLGQCMGVVRSCMCTHAVRIMASGYENEENTSGIISLRYLKAKYQTVSGLSAQLKVISIEKRAITAQRSLHQHQQLYW